MNKTRWFHDGMQNAPVVDVNPGSMIAILDACLVNGWGLKTATSAVASNGTLTVTVDNGHGFEVDQIINLDSAVPVEFNGDYKVKTAPNNTVFTCDTDQPDQTVGGVILVKVAPCGWTKPYADGITKAVYRNESVLGTGLYLQIIDDGNRANAGSAPYAGLVQGRGFEDMTDVDTGTNVVYSDYEWLTRNAGMFYKKLVVNDKNVGWAIVGDDRAFYLQSTAGNGEAAVSMVGDLNDPGLHPAWCAAMNLSAYPYEHYHHFDPHRHMAMSRDILDQPNPTLVTVGGGYGSSQKSGTSENNVDYPCPYNGGMIGWYPLPVRHLNAPHHIRGTLPGEIDLPFNGHGFLTNRQIYNFDNLGKVYILAGPNTSYLGYLLEDWR